MEGVQFLLIAWSIWLFFVFFSEAKYAKTVRITVLLMIIFFPYSFSSGNVQINGSFIICLLFASYLLTDDRSLYKCYHFLLSLTITCASVAFQLFEIFDPVSMFLNRTVMFSVIIVALVLAFPLKAGKRLPVLMMGLVQAEFIYKQVLARLTLERTIGDAAFFDLYAMSVLLLLIWQGFELLTKRLSESVTQANQSAIKNSVGEY